MDAPAYTRSDNYSPIFKKDFSSYSFDGKSDYLSEDVSALNNLSDFTVCFRFKGRGWLLSKGIYCTKPPSWGVYITDSRIVFYYGTNDKLSTLRNEFVPHNLDLNKEHSVVIKIAGLKLSFFANGVYLGERSLNNKPINNLLPLHVGANHCINELPNENHTFHGRINEVEIYNFALENSFASMFGSPLLEITGLEGLSKNDLRFEWRVTDIYKNGVSFKFDAVSDFSNLYQNIFKDTLLVYSGPALSAFSFPFEVTENKNPVFRFYTFENKHQVLDYESLEITLPPQARKELNFFGFEGAGKNTSGGENGAIYHVTNLNDSGPGSLRYGLNLSGARNIVFSVSGYIDLLSPLLINSPDISVWGQTAPGKGVVVRNNGLIISASNVIIQHMSFHVGDLDFNNGSDSKDAISIVNYTPSLPLEDIIIDHCSLLWSIDENFSIWGGNVQNVTLSNCLIAEALDHSFHSKGAHSKGVLIGHSSKNISIIRNILFANYDRNPLVQGNTETYFVNNWISSGGSGFQFSDANNSGPINTILINNLVEINNQTNKRKKLAVDKVRGSIYIKPKFDFEDLSVVGSLNRNEYFQNWDATHTILSMSDLKPALLKSSGARPWDRIEAELRCFEKISSNAGSFIDCVSSEVHVSTINISSISSNLVKTKHLLPDFLRNFNPIYIIDSSGNYLTEASFLNSTSLNVSDSKKLNTNMQYSLVRKCQDFAGGWSDLENTQTNEFRSANFKPFSGNSYSDLEQWLFNNYKLCKE